MKAKKLSQDEQKQLLRIEKRLRKRQAESVGRPFGTHGGCCWGQAGTGPNFGTQGTYHSTTGPDAMDIDPPESAPTSSSICHFLEVNHDIRKIIYRYLFVRPVALVPTMVHYQVKLGGPKQKLNIYSYVFEHDRQVNWDEEKLPRYDSTGQKATMAWITAPNKTQRNRIGKDKKKTPADGRQSKKRAIDTKRDVNGDKISTFVHVRSEDLTQIIHSGKVETTGIQGIALLQTCKQIALEGAAMLYGANCVVFDTSGNPPFSSESGVHEHYAFDTHREHIPGISYMEDPRRPEHFYPNGRQASKRDIWAAIDKMFDKPGYHSPFVFRDPLMNFFMEIGRGNARLIKKVKFEGKFLTAKEGKNTMHAQPIGFARLLHIYTVILRNVCKDLTTVTLHRKGTEGSRWEDDLYRNSGKSDDEKIDEAVWRLINGLPQITTLHLGSYTQPPSPKIARPKPVAGVPFVTFPPRIDEWGSALKHIKTVEDRDPNALLKQREKEEASAKRKEQAEKEKTTSDFAADDKDGDAEMEDL